MGSIRRLTRALTAAVAIEVAAVPNDALPQAGGNVPIGVESTPPETRPKTDETLEATIAQALTDDRRVNPMQVKIAVHDGLVTLTGSAKDVAQKDAAEAIVRGVRGVRDVENRLVVAEPPGAPEPGTSVIPEVPAPPAR
jgi:osmotically-inducible protein OsmY